MFLIKSIKNIFSPTENVQEEIERLNDILDVNVASQLERQNVLFTNKKLLYDDNEEDAKKNAVTDCFKRSGIITQINGDRAVINNILHFNIPEAASNLQDDLEIGLKVDYLAYNASNSTDEQEIKVSKILEIIEYTFEAPTEEHLKEESAALASIKPEYFTKHKRNYFGHISKKTQNHLTVAADQEILIDYQSVSMDFLPQLGDLVVVLCYVQTDEKFVDKAGEILEALKVTPQRIDIKNTKIVEIYDNYGIFEDEDCYFLFDILNNTGYKPAVGDFVEIECIESNGSYCNDLLSKCEWRCTKIKLLKKGPEPKINHEPDNNVLASWQSNKNGIKVTDNVNIKFTQLGQKKEIKLKVQNDGNDKCTIVYWKFKGNKSESQLKLINPKYNSPAIDLDIGANSVFTILAEAIAPGLREEYFEFKFIIKQSDTLHQDTRFGFQIGRKIAVDVGDPTDENYETRILKLSRFVKNNNTDRVHFGLTIERMKKRRIVPGVKPTISPRFIEQRIGNFPIPQSLEDAVFKSIDQNEMKQNIDKICHSLTQNLNSDNYVQRFECLLHLEEIEQCFQIRNYDCERAHFIRQDDFLRLNIDNLAEKRPSLVIGDCVKAIPIGNNSKTLTECNQGFIHKVLHNHILLKFNPTFHDKYNGEDNRLYFEFSRSSFRKNHHAIVQIKKKFNNEFLFPTKVILQSNPQVDCNLNESNKLILNTTTRKFNWFNSNLNNVQKIAIKNILRGEARPMPFVIFGPPGTGKTMTVIETILQLFKNCSNSRILVAAPSNSAADLIATRLINSEALEPGDFLRIISHNIIENDLVPEHLKAYCATIDIAAIGSTKSEMIKTESGLILKCSKTQLCASRILIGTCMSLATLLFIKFPLGHFTHAIIDEAGQCIEPETMTVISQIENQRGQVILAGDPLQLGPIIINKYACEKGLQLSYLSRLLSTKPYTKDKVIYPDSRGYNERLVAKLIYNYRSVPSILHTFNDLFYDGELLSTVDCNNSEEALLLKTLSIPQPNTRVGNFGVIFHGVRGENLQDSDSPSWYNAAEAYRLVLFTIKLLQQDNIHPRNIGIITPYNQQVKKIRELLQTMSNLKRECMPKIGSVEEFQGQERDIILISTVRSSKNLLVEDLKYTLGFVQSEKRMNVAISRAKSLLVIFGNPLLLKLDANWNKLIQYCINNNSTIGCETLKIEEDDGNEK